MMGFCLVWTCIPSQLWVHANALRWLERVGCCSHPLPLALTAFVLFLQWFTESSLRGRGVTSLSHVRLNILQSPGFFVLWSLGASVRGETSFCKWMTPARSSLLQRTATHPRVLRWHWSYSMNSKKWGHKVGWVGNKEGDLGGVGRMGWIGSKCSARNSQRISHCI